MKIRCTHCKTEFDAEKSMSAIITAQKGTPYCEVSIYCSDDCMIADKEKSLPNHVIRRQKLIVTEHPQITLTELFEEIRRMWHTNFVKYTKKFYR